jgi:hypothetical protein
VKKVIPALILLVMVSLTACAARPAPASTAAEPPPQPAAPAQAPAVEGQAYDGGANSAPDDTSRMIVRTGDVQLIVTDAGQARDSIAAAVSGMDGYVADSSVWREGEQLRARLTVRVPAERLDALLANMKQLAVRVQQEDIKSQDVTEEYTDLNAQLTNLEATEKELRELLAEVRQKTQKAEDVLAVYRELTQIRGEIERVKGRMQYLSTVTALATLNVDLIPDELAKPVVEPGWRPAETLRSAGRTLVNSLQGLANALIWVVIYLLPLLLVIAIPIVLVVLLLRWLIRREHRAPTG